MDIVGGSTMVSVAGSILANDPRYELERAHDIEDRSQGSRGNLNGVNTSYPSKDSEECSIDSVK